MMRTLLDRLLFRASFPAFRASLVRGALSPVWPAAVRPVPRRAVHARARRDRPAPVVGRLPGVQVSMSRPEMSFFPPALEIADLTVQPPNASEPLAFRNVRAGLTVFPLGISLDADIAGGELNATVIPSSLWNPERLAVRSSLSGVGIEPLLRPFMGKTSLVQIRSGKLEGSATLDLPLLNGRPEPLAGEGSLNLSCAGLGGSQPAHAQGFPLGQAGRRSGNRLEKGTADLASTRRAESHACVHRSRAGHPRSARSPPPAAWTCSPPCASRLNRYGRNSCRNGRSNPSKTKAKSGYASGIPSDVPPLTYSPDRRAL